MNPDPVCRLVYVMIAAHHGPHWIRSPVDMGAFHRCPLRLMITGAVPILPIIDPIGDWHRSRDELTLIHAEHADVSGNHVLQSGIANRPTPVPHGLRSVVGRWPLTAWQRTSRLLMFRLVRVRPMPLAGPRRRAVLLQLSRWNFIVFDRYRHDRRGHLADLNHHPRPHVHRGSAAPRSALS
jgi:hypothetical protein